MSVCSDTCIVPNSAAKELPILPAITMDVTTGLNSRENARASTPPIERWRPSFINSLTNWIVKAMPTKVEVKRQTPTDFGPTLSSCWSVFLQWILPFRILVKTCPAMMKTDSPRQRYSGGDHLVRGLIDS